MKKQMPTLPTFTPGSENRDTPDNPRRGFLLAGAAVAAGTFLPGLTGTALGADASPNAASKAAPRGRRILLKGGVVLSMDPKIGNFENADVLIEGAKIVAVGPNLKAAAQVVDASGCVVMPGFIDTHHHQYETIQRSALADGILAGAWPARTYVSVVQQIWTAGAIPGVFDMKRSPYDPEDCEISQLVASLSQIRAGVTTGVDTSQSSHTPAHTDAMIAGLREAGRRTLFAYSPGRADQPGYEFPGRRGVSATGLGRLRREFFNSDDQLLTLGFNGPLAPVAGPGTETGWEMARSFGAPIVVHNVANPGLLINNPDAMGPDVELIHCVQWNNQAWDIAAAKGVHVSLAFPIEMQMRHGMPPIQQCRDRKIVPSLSSDVETNMAADMFTVMRSAFTLQRALLNERYINNEPNLPQLVSADQVLEWATMAGARAAQLDRKVGSLTPGKEADVIVLDGRMLNVAPMNNAPGTVVTMMDTSNVKHVFIAGKTRVWNGKLLGVNEERLRRAVEASRDRVVARIKAAFAAYSPSMLESCCLPYQ
jgi:5-methylthioadenosine/S-adenosylhomocysteine deaminase